MVPGGETDIILIISSLPVVQLELDICAFKWNTSTTIEQIPAKFAKDIHAPHRMNHNNYGNPSCFHLAPPSVQFSFVQYFVSWL